MTQTYDYIIVGAGSAGCVLANRLSQDGTHNVCLIEAGPVNSSMAIKIPAGVVSLIDNPKINWCYESCDEPELNNRRIHTPRGKVLGGSSSINAMVYIRGSAGDYDGWRDLGNAGWGYEDVLPYFKKSENHHLGDSQYHSSKGELPVTLQRSVHPLTNDFVAAGRAAGYEYNSDFNGANQEGVGVFEVNQVKGQRCSSADAFLVPAANRPNLTVMTDCTVNRLILEGNKATGVEIEQNNATQVLQASREILVSGGVYNSPKLLMLSGIGDREALQSKGIECLVDLPGVGKNLQNHLDVVIGNAISNRNSYAVAPIALAKAGLEVLKFMFQKKGMLTSVFSEAGGFIRTDPDLKYPDSQLHFIPMLLDDHGRNTKVAMEYGYSLHVCLLTPESRGEVLLASSNPQDKPLIKNNFLGDPSDLPRLVNAIRKAHKVTQQEPLKQQFKRCVFPGDDSEELSDETIVQFIREKANHLYHGVGTCKMGNDSQAVVDETLRVKGVDNLRVVDASIMPVIPRGNTHAPTVMIAEKAAAMILKVN